MVLPPFDAGAFQLTVAWALPAVAVTLVGAPGTPPGVMLFDAVEAGLVPTLLVAVTVNVYAVPLVRPPTVALVVTPSGVLTLMFPGDEVTV